MRILMISAIAPVGQVLKRGLEKRGHSVILVDNPSPFDDGMTPEYELKWGLPIKRYGNAPRRAISSLMSSLFLNLDESEYGDCKVGPCTFDIVHVHSPNLKKILIAYPYVKSGVPLICHWHGSDLRVWKKSFPVKNWCIQHAKMNLYSTCDLAWWIQNDNKMLINCPVDTDLFKPGNSFGVGKVIFNGGAKAFADHRIPHKDMPDYLRKYASASIHNAMGLDDNLYSIIAFECASCGLKVDQFPWMDREWVLKNASMDVIAKKMEEIYNEALY